MIAESKALSVALVGNPNAGKSTLFNALTGSRQHVGNWPGKTVEKKTGEFQHDGRLVEITDLPGAYSLSAYTIEESVTRDYLLDDRPDVIIAVADATNLERNLYLIVQLLELALPSVVVLNMFDVAEQQGLKIDTRELGKALGVPIITTIARREHGIEDVAAAAWQAARAPTLPRQMDYGAEIEAEIDHLDGLIEELPAEGVANSSRWTALRLLEGDEGVAARLVNLTGGARVVAESDQCRARLVSLLGDEVDLEIADRRYTWIHELAGRVVQSTDSEELSRSDRIDRIVTDRRLGIPIFLLAMWFVFKVTTDLSTPWVDWIDGVLSGPVSRWGLAVLGAAGLGDSWIASLVVDGIFAGVGGVLAFVPVLMFLYLALAILEDSGYMARGAFVMDRSMNRVGLHGRSFLPLMVGFGCSVPAIYATRTLTNKRDRILTGLLVPFMSCGARLPVYALFAAIFFPRYSSMVILGLYLLGIGVAIAVGLVLQRTVLPSTAAAGLVMELPPYRLPNARSIRYHMWLRTRAFLQHAASLILVTTVLIWLLTAIPAGGHGTFADTPIAESVFGRVSNGLAPALRPLGFGTWQSSGALISGLVAKEVVVSTLAQTYGMGSELVAGAGGSLFADLAEIVTSFGRAVLETLRALPGLIGINLAGNSEVSTPGLSAVIFQSFAVSSGGHAVAAGLSFMVFVLLYTPCMATIAAERHELGMRWTCFSLFCQLAIAWMVALFAFRIAMWLGG